MFALTCYHDLQDALSVSTPIDHHIRMQDYELNSTPRTNWFELAGTWCSLSGPEPVNAFESIEGWLDTEVHDVVLPAYLWEQSDVPSQ